MSKSLVIIVVDDDAAIRRALARTLKEDRHTVLEAESGDKGMEVLTAQEGDDCGVDAVFSDMDMPGGMNGLQFLQEVEKRYPRIIRILMSGNVERKDLVQAYQNRQVHRLMSKPWRTGEPFAVLELELNVRATEGPIALW